MSPTTAVAALPFTHVLRIPTEIPPLYTLSIYNAIANDGVYVKPRLVKELISTNGVDSVLPVAYMGNGRACSQQTAERMRMMLTQVVWGDHGTGKMLRNDKVRIAGKTGTCYMIEGGGYNTSKSASLSRILPG